MKKISKMLILFAVCSTVMLFSFTASASAIDYKAEDLYGEKIEEAINSLDDDVIDVLNSLGLQDFSPDGLSKISISNAFHAIVRILKGAYKEPFLMACTLLGIMLLNAVAGCYISGGSLFIYFETVSVLFSGLLIFSEIIECIMDAVSAIHSISVLMKLLVPSMAIMATVSGSPAAAVSYNAVTVYIAEIISAVCSDLFAPILCVFAAVAVCGSVNPSVKASPILELIKKIVNTLLGFAGTIFTGVLGIKNILTAGIDRVSVKGIKFILGSAVPVVGSTLSEGLSSVIAAAALMKSAYGVFIMILTAVIALPVITELILWQLSMSVGAYAAAALGQEKNAEILSSLKFVLSIMMSLILFCVFIFIISTAMIILLNVK